MIFEQVFARCQEQYLDIHTWMQEMNIAFKTLRENNSTNTMKIDKVLKRITRIEDKLKIENLSHSQQIPPKGNHDHTKEGD